MLDRYSKTADGQQFLQAVKWIDGPDSQALLLFISEHGKEVLRTSTTWTMDGTFATCPDRYEGFTRLANVWVIKVGKCPVGKCPGWQMSGLANVWLANVRLGNVQLANVRLANVRSSFLHAILPCYEERERHKKVN